jgi:hypothetical protein
VEKNVKKYLSTTVEIPLSFSEEKMVTLVPPIS